MVDIGCGGGLLPEEFARLGAHVLGSIRRHHHSTLRARMHEHRGSPSTTARELASSCRSTTRASTSHVVEVNDLDAVLAETSRVLRPNGVYLFDTINRTGLSRLVMIKLFQEWRLTAWMPPNLHSWEQLVHAGRAAGEAR